ncbi:sulfatase [Streptomyces sp. NPDC005336]|uniref:sulfatase family protein n=1 Tax=Streptomyces sp. NPDC005336 TaxID=3157035 RepID=UPI0033AFE0D9
MLGIQRRRTATAGLCMAVAAALLTSCLGKTDTARAGRTDASADSTTRAAHKPNIVYVLTDDLSSNLIRYMPHVQQMEKSGTSFPNLFTTDSLCCPSRSSIFTGQYPHNTGVFTNNGADGGYGAFTKNDNEHKSFAPALQRAGYRTGFMGKYLNGYRPKNKYVPPGWDEWDVAGDGYRNYNYDLNENGEVERYGEDPQDYLTDVLSKKATSFVDSSAKADKPFMLTVATFTPHAPAIPAPRHIDEFPTLKAPRTPAYDRTSEPAPKWQRKLTPLTPKEKKQIDGKFRQRVRSVQAVDEMIGHLRSRLKEKGLADNTYLVFGSDNGFHMGEYRLRPGKQTAYDTDIRVPMVVTGPDVPAGKSVSQLAENVDLNPTFLELAGAKPPSTVDGRSLSGLLHGRRADDWRDAVLVEHHHAKSKKNDPDAAPDDAGNPPSYEAIRTADSLYIEYATGEREYYETRSDPHQLKNLAASLPAEKRASLHKTLTALKHCRGAKSCQAASRVQK